ncbi:hypothetical protein D3C80_431870 [compost metagenome]
MILFFLFYGYVSDQPIALLAVLGVLFFVYFVILIYTLNRNQNKPVLIISKEGLYYKNIGLITWEYISGVKINVNFFNRLESNLLTISLKNQDPLIIPTNNLDHSCEELAKKNKLL